MTDGAHRANSPLGALAEIVCHMRTLKRPFALVGGLAVSVRSEVRFTRDVDLALDVATDAEMKSLVRDLSARGYRAVAVVEHEAIGAHRNASASLETGRGGGSLGRYERHRARDRRPCDERRLRRHGRHARRSRRRAPRDEGAPVLELDDVRANLALIEARGYHREQDLMAKLDGVLESARRA